MSGTIFTSGVVQSPLPAGVIANGATLIRCAGHATASFSEGDVVTVAPATGSDIVTYATFTALEQANVNSWSIVASIAVAASDAAGADQCRLKGVLLEDIAALGVGWVMLRGTCLANVQARTGSDIDLGDSLYVGSAEAGITDLWTMTALKDLTIVFVARVIGISLRTTAVSPAAITKIPVLFDGINGFGTHQGL